MKREPTHFADLCVNGRPRETILLWECETVYRDDWGRQFNKDNGAMRMASRKHPYSIANITPYDPSR